MINIEVKLEDLNGGLTKAYENIAKKAGLNVTENSNFDCRYIEVSKLVDEYFWKWYKDKAKKENPRLNEQDIKCAIAMMMLNCGAKVNENLENWYVSVDENFVVNK